MTHLHRITINTALRSAWPYLRTTQTLHAAIAKATHTTEPQHRTLWRLDHHPNHTHLYLLTPTGADLAALSTELNGTTTYDTRPYTPLLEALNPNQHWKFRLTANPTRSKATTRGTRGRTIPIHHPTDQLTWLATRADQHGFTITNDDSPTAQVIEHHTNRFKGSTEQVALKRATFEGILTITNPDQLRHTLTAGIGKAKSYGCGLLTLTRP